MCYIIFLVRSRWVITLNLEIKQVVPFPPNTHTPLHALSWSLVPFFFFIIIFRTILWSLIRLLSPFPYPVSLQFLTLASVALIVLSPFSPHITWSSLSLCHALLTAPRASWISRHWVYPSANTIARTNQDVCVLVEFPVLTLCVHLCFLPCQTQTLHSNSRTLYSSFQTLYSSFRSPWPSLKLSQLLPIP